MEIRDVLEEGRRSIAITAAKRPPLWYVNTGRENVTPLIPIKLTIPLGWCRAPPISTPSAFSFAARSSALSALPVARLLLDLKLVNDWCELTQYLVGLLVEFKLSSDKVGQVA